MFNFLFRSYRFFLSVVVVSKKKDIVDDVVLFQKNEVLVEKEVLETKLSVLNTIFDFCIEHPYMISSCLFFITGVIVYYFGFYNDPNVLDISGYSLEVQNYLQIPFERWNAYMLYKIYDEIGDVNFGNFVNLNKIPADQLDLFFVLQSPDVDPEIINEVLSAFEPSVIITPSPEFIQAMEGIINSL